MNSRACAAKIVLKIIHKRVSLNQAIIQAELSKLSTVDRSFVLYLSYGTVRWYLRLEPISRQLLHKPLPQKHHDVLIILLIFGLLLLVFLHKVGLVILHMINLRYIEIAGIKVTINFQFAASKIK